MFEQLTKIYTEGAEKLASLEEYGDHDRRNEIFAEVKDAVKSIGGTFDTSRLICAEDNIRRAGERKVYANMAGQVIGL